MMTTATARLLRAIVDARTNNMDDVDLIALINAWKRDAQKLLDTAGAEGARP